MGIHGFSLVYGIPFQAKHIQNILPHLYSETQLKKCSIHCDDFCCDGVLELPPVKLSVVEKYLVKTVPESALEPLPSSSPSSSLPLPSSSSSSLPLPSSSSPSPSSPSPSSPSPSLPLPSPSSSSSPSFSSSTKQSRPSSYEEDVFLHWNVVPHDISERYSEMKVAVLGVTMVDARVTSLQPPALRAYSECLLVRVRVALHALCALSDTCLRSIFLDELRQSCQLPDSTQLDSVTESSSQLCDGGIGGVVAEDIDSIVSLEKMQKNKGNKENKKEKEEKRKQRRQKRERVLRALQRLDGDCHKYCSWRESKRGDWKKVDFTPADYNHLVAYHTIPHDCLCCT